VVTAAVQTPTRKSAGARRIGYTIAVLLDLALLFLINSWPGWSALPFLTAEMAGVLTVITASLVIGAAVNLVYLVHDAPWLVAAGGIITTAVGVVVLVRLWQVYPFDLGAGWSITVRVLLVVAVLGSIAGVVVQTVALAAALGRRAHT